MDTAKRFKPNTILLWRKVAKHPEARRILGLFPSAQVRLIERQREDFLSGMSMSEALLAGKKTLMIGETSSFVGHFDGQLGSNVCCCPYYKLVPVSNGCPYYCTYCYLAYVYSKFAPFIKININFEKDVSIGLCRETPQIWSIFKDRCERQQCNCVIW